MDAERTAELARISGALVRALEHAQPLAARGDFGADLVELLRHARDLHDLARGAGRRSAPSGTFFEAGFDGAGQHGGNDSAKAPSRC